MASYTVPQLLTIFHLLLELSGDHPEAETGQKGQCFFEQNQNFMSFAVEGVLIQHTWHRKGHHEAVSLSSL